MATKPVTWADLASSDAEGNQKPEFKKQLETRRRGLVRSVLTFVKREARLYAAHGHLRNPNLWGGEVRFPRDSNAEDVSKHDFVTPAEFEDWVDLGSKAKMRELVSVGEGNGSNYGDFRSEGDRYREYAIRELVALMKCTDRKLIAKGLSSTSATLPGGAWIELEDQAAKVYQSRRGEFFNRVHNDNNLRKDVKYALMMDDERSRMYFAKLLRGIRETAGVSTEQVGTRLLEVIHPGVEQTSTNLELASKCIAEFERTGKPRYPLFNIKGGREHGFVELTPEMIGFSYGLSAEQFYTRICATFGHRNVLRNPSPPVDAILALRGTQVVVANEPEEPLTRADELCQRAADAGVTFVPNKDRGEKSCADISDAAFERGLEYVRNTRAIAEQRGQVPVLYEDAKGQLRPRNEELSVNSLRRLRNDTPRAEWIKIIGAACSQVGIDFEPHPDRGPNDPINMRPEGILKVVTSTMAMALSGQYEGQRPKRGIL